MKLEQIPIRLSEEHTGNTSYGQGAVLTCYVKDNMQKKPDSRRKAVIICPGGGYEHCSTREAEPVAMQFLAMDCHAFVLNYSTKPSPFPVALMELAMAVSIVRGHADEWHIDKHKIVVCGFSSGGHLAASLGVFWDREFLSNPLSLKPEDVHPDGLILAYPVISSGAYGHDGSFSILLPEHDGGIKDSGGFTREFLSLETQVGPQVPPVFMWHTDTDKTVPAENSLLFSMALRKAGVSQELHIFTEGRHGLSLANEETDDPTRGDMAGSYVVPSCQVWIKLAKVWLDRL